MELPLWTLRWLICNSVFTAHHLCLLWGGVENQKCGRAMAVACKCDYYAFKSWLFSHTQGSFQLSKFINICKAPKHKSVFSDIPIVLRIAQFGKLWNTLLHDMYCKHWDFWADRRALIICFFNILSLLWQHSCCLVFSWFPYCPFIGLF